jgi:hypothetical protein
MTSRAAGATRCDLPPRSSFLQGVGEVPGGAFLDFDVELLSIKQDAVGYRTKLVEG